MDYETQLKVQAWLDGELPAGEAREMANRLAGDREAAALAEELRNTGKALAGFAADIRLPESREFFWSKVERAIRRGETPARQPAPTESYVALLRRFLVPAFAVAVVLVAGSVLMRPTVPPGHAPVADIEVAQADAGAFTYRDYAAGATLVWFSYPAENDVADDEETGTVN